ncbi:MAG: preprotein translocase subunit SecG [Cytophagales bacterium]|nr:preprotein translocase subunit SecG [Cytophagales bacterium]
MFTFLTTLIIITAILLILIVSIQNVKGGGLSSQLGGASTNQLIGVKKTSDLLEQITWGLAITIFVLTLATSLYIDSGQNEGKMPSSPNIERAQEHNALPSLTPNVDEESRDAAHEEGN